MIPELAVHQGHFLTHEISAPLARPLAGTRDVYDCAVVVSNDSDLAESMRLVRLHHPGKVIGLIFPRQGGPGARHAHPSRELTRHAHFVKHLGKSVLAACQIPNSIPGTTIHKPPTW